MFSGLFSKPTAGHAFRKAIERVHVVTDHARLSHRKGRRAVVPLHDRGQHIEPANPQRDEIAEGRQRSAIFAKQIDDLAARRVVVDVRWSLKIHPRLDAALLHATRVSPNGTRYYFVVINARRVQANASPRFTTPILAHELQHVFEALDGGEPIMINGQVHETEAAQRVQAAVANEIIVERLAANVPR